MSLIRNQADYKFSPSAIDTFSSCARKWAWDKIGKVPRAQHPSAAKGDRCHKQLERYLETGEHPRHLDERGVVDETGAIVEPCLSTVPAPGTVEVEKKFVFSSPRTGFLYSGRIDWQRRLTEADARAFGYEDPGNWAEVGDHKSTGNLRHAKTPETLLTDPQGVIYAVATMAEFEVPHVRLHWNYIHTGHPRKVLPVIQEVHSEGVAREFERIEGIAGQMANFLDTIDPEHIMDVPGNEGDACRAYGGCPYRHKCFSTVEDTLGSVFSEIPDQPQGDQMDLLEQMKARRAGVAVPPVAPTSPPPVAPAAGPAPVAMTAAASPALQALTAQANVAPAAPTAPVLSSDQVPAPEGIPAWLTVAPGQINPPETSAPPTALELAASEKAAKPAKASTRAKAAPKVESPAPTQADLDLAQKGSDIAARGMIQMGMPIAFLFVDCAPVRGWNALDGAELATEANRLACKGWEDAGKGKLADYRFGPFELTGMLAKAGESLIRGQAERTGQPVSITLSSQTPEGRILLNPLSALAACVVKGVQS